MILEDVDFPFDAVVTVISVDTSLDLRYADVYISVIPKEKEDAVLAFLEEDIYAMQQKINKKLFMKPVPKIRFRLDLGGDHFDRINEIISETDR